MSKKKKKRFCTICNGEKSQYVSNLVVNTDTGKVGRVIVSYCETCDKNQYPPPKIDRYIKNMEEE